MKSRTETGVERPVQGEAGDEVALPASQASLVHARRYVEHAATAFGFDPDSCYQFVFAVNEAVTNAVKHGGENEQGLIHLSAVAEDDRLTFLVRDHGCFRVSSPDQRTRLEHGRGLAFMASLTDKVSVSANPHGTIVSLSKARA